MINHMRWISIGLFLVACGGSGSPARTPPVGITSFDGQVIGADQKPPEDQLAENVQLTLRDSKGEEVVVELAPGWYLDEKGLHFNPEDRVRVKGSRHKGKPGVVATEVETKGKSVKLRNESGEPLWPRRTPKD